MVFSLSLSLGPLTTSLKVKYFIDNEPLCDGGQRRISVMAGLSPSDKLTSPPPISSTPLWKFSSGEPGSFVQLSWTLAKSVPTICASCQRGNPGCVCVSVVLVVAGFFASISLFLVCLLSYSVVEFRS